MRQRRQVEAKHNPYWRSAMLKVGPTLFSFYIADLPRPTEPVRRICYAADITVWASGVTNLGTRAKSQHLFDRNLPVLLAQLAIDISTKVGCCCCLPTPLTFVCGGGGGPIIPLLVHQPAYIYIWPAAPSLQRGLSTNPGVTVWCVCGWS